MGSLFDWLLVLHIAVLGYWLGAELVINATFRYVCFRRTLPFSERDHLMGHVMDVDQHVRYALVLQLGLGTMLCALMGYLPGGSALAMVAAAVGIGWLIFIEVVHRYSNHAAGHHLARVDRATRYVLIPLLIATGLGVIGSDWLLPDWLRWKLVAFAGVAAAGVGIRLALLPLFRTWSAMRERGVTQQDNAALERGYWVATSVLIVLWVFISVVVLLSVVKPAP